MGFLWDSALSVPAPGNKKSPSIPVFPRGSRGFLAVTTVVEMGGIEPPSIAGSLRLLRAQSVQTFCSAPTFVTDT